MGLKQPNGVANVNQWSSFEVTGIHSDNSLTGMRNEIVLSTWLIVLLRTREGNQVGYDWRYQDQQDDVSQEAATGRISMSEVMSGLQDKVEDVIASVSRDIQAICETHSTSASRPVSLILSTSSLEQTSEEERDEGILHTEIRCSHDSLRMRPLWHTENMSPFTIARYIETFADTLQMCIADPKAAVEDCLRPTAHDLDAIWQWNHELPPSHNFCMQEMVTMRAQELQEKIAIVSWDGELTYTQVEHFSTAVALSLKGMDVQLGDVIPVCFEKSRWTAVAVLGVMKAGGTLALMDPTLPLARLQNMAKQVGAKAMVSSRRQSTLAKIILPDGKHLAIDKVTFADVSFSTPLPSLPIIPPSTLMYIIFTSGSTGTPKGVTISHGTYTSSAIPRGKAVGYTEESRVLDFASYAFDVSIDSMLLTLGNGGCLCIPSDEDRLNDINEVIRKMNVNYAGLTPSVARILDPDVISSLSGLGLGGEAASARDVNLWGQDTRIIIGYGPCECTIGCTINSSAATGRDYISIGTGNGAAMWIVNPNDHENLMPVGAVGELLVEGPIVGQGYLNDPEKTARAFIEDPSWLVAGNGDYVGRRGRLYKTGDLGKYDPDGSGGIIFAGRKDTQVKLRGQRVELGEIESQLNARLPSDINVIAEVIVPRGSGGQPTLVAFIAPQSTKSNEVAELCLEKPQGELRETLSQVNDKIAAVLPRYMVPTSYILVSFIPVLISGKTDRKRLRQLGTTVDLRHLDQDSTQNTTRELSDLEKRLQQAWGQILKLEAESIRIDDNFFALGGDSLAAMKLVTVCRGQGLDLSVIHLFNNPTLAAMAGIAKTSNPQGRMETSPFSMIQQSSYGARLEAGQIYGFDAEAVEDIYPCTPTQESLFTFSLKSSKAYVAQRVACIPSDIETNSWKNAWELVVTSSPILRTRVVQLQEPGLQQVVLKDDIKWVHSSSLNQYLEKDREQKMNLGERLARYAIVHDLKDGKRYMVWTIHHVLYDGWSEPIILKQVSDALHQKNIEAFPQIRDFVRHMRNVDEAAVHEFWRRELKGAVGPQFPRLPSRDYLPTPDGFLEHKIFLDTGAGSPFTLATLIRGAWALVAAQYTGSDDVVFGETLTGRDIPLPEVESIVGPLIATVPNRVLIHRTANVESYLQMIQQSVLARTPYQHMGMQNIRKVSQDAQHACEAPTGLVIQPEPEYAGSDLGFQIGDVVREALHFNPYPLMLAFGVGKGGVRVCASWDTALIEVSQMERVLMQLEAACSRLTADLSRKLGDISCLPDVELDKIWQWNQTPPLPFDRSSKTFRASDRIKQGAVYPKAAIPWVCNPKNPSLLSPIGCLGELWLETAFLGGDFIECPRWLVNGSSKFPGRKGHIQQTGDIVRLLDDNIIVFVGRKENVTLIEGHAVDVTDLEAHLRRYLPSSSRVAVAVSTVSDTIAEKDTALVVFIEQPRHEKESLQILPADHAMTCLIDDGTVNITICSMVSVHIAEALRKSDKFIRDSLPSYTVPFAYVVVDRLPVGSGQVEHNQLNKMASEMPSHLLRQVRQGFKIAWKRMSTRKDLTPAENALRLAWANVLRMDPEKIDSEDNFFRLGGDSVLAMKLVSSLRMQGHGLTVADIFQNMRLGDAARVLRMESASIQAVPDYKPFSTLGRYSSKFSAEEMVRPKLVDSSWSVQDVLPVIDSQEMDIQATIYAPRTSLQYTMLYFGDKIDRMRLLDACKNLVQTHDILRTVFVEHESRFLQVVLKDLDVPVDIYQADKDLQRYVVDLCNGDIESNYPLGSPFAKFFLVEGKNSQVCLTLALSHALYDGISLPQMLQDLETLYSGSEIVNFQPFSTYVARVCDQQLRAKAIDYWSNLLEGSSLSVMKGSSAQHTDKAIFRTKAVDISQRPGDITTANLLTAAWALVLARRLRTRDVTFGSVTSGRVIDLQDIENVMGPCYQLMPVRVSFDSAWTAMDLLQFVQEQSAQSVLYDFLGFRTISEKCTHWDSSAQGFDSIVHHQDWEDFDTMPFSGETCNVDILNPHGDAVYPLKAVTFVKKGVMHVGFVGSERDMEFVDATVVELAGAVEELAGHSPKPLLHDSVF
ncbi:AMP-dependent synthetase/ligase [Penicillium capsulatum]|uniref:AMP-dependent synthetase/ligase n=1 Tax=Penicillium capsulatum TaxID=69766 RepID=A0A9W9HL41_9EURO|nr:AMP-dependent synthetase/ligase [Penicillium capsulatum]KAJ6112816.1 AMP-dependent synthetase/ligase [Penicillium capsulatum]